LFSYIVLFRDLINLFSNKGPKSLLQVGIKYNIVLAQYLCVYSNNSIYTHNTVYIHTYLHIHITHMYRNTAAENYLEFT